MNWKIDLIIIIYNMSVYKTYQIRTVLPIVGRDIWILESERDLMMEVYRSFKG